MNRAASAAQAISSQKARRSSHNDCAIAARTLAFIKNQHARLRVEVVAPMTFGLHTISVRDIKTKKVIDGTMFIIRHNDAPSERDLRPHN
jgi:cytidylate kinase